MLWARVWIYAGVLALAAIGLLPGAVFIGLLALVLPGLILLAAPTVALYLPFADMMVTGLVLRRWWLSLLGLAAATAIAVLPPMTAGRLLDAEIATATKGDFDRDPGTRPHRILLHDYRRSEGSKPHGWVYEGPAASGCDETCARLLLSGQVEAIIRPVSGGKGPADLEKGFAGPAIVYSFEPAPTCPEAKGLGVSPETLAFIGSGQCIVAREVTDPVFDAAMTSLHDSLDIPRLDLKDPGVADVTRWTIWRCSAGACARTAVTTSVKVRRLAVPLLVGVENSSDMNMRRTFWRREQQIRPTSAEALLARRFQLHPTAPPPPDPARIRTAAETALAVTARENRRPSDAEVEVIERALKPVAEARTPPTDADVRLLRAIIGHPSANWIYGFGEVLRRHPDTAVQLAGDLVAGYDRVTLEGDVRAQRDLRLSLARAIAAFPDKTLQAYRPQILSAAARPEALESAGDLLVRLGDLGPQATPLLVRSLSQKGEDQYSAALGLCRVGAPAGDAAPALAAVQNAGGPDAFGRRAKTMALALARIGRPDLVRQRDGEAFERGNAAAQRHERAWYETVLPTITPASPAEVCSEKTVRKR